MKKILLFLLSLTLALFTLNSCEDYSDIEGVAPVINGISGNANLTKFVTIGNSLTAGYQSSALYESAQIYSFGNLIAKQVNSPFAMPLYSDPGTGGRMEVQALTASGIATVFNPNVGSPININYPAPYNNLGVPGALLYDVVYATNANNCASAVFSNRPNPMFDLVLRNSALNLGTQIQQALALQPTFVTLWIGNNDVLGYATSGGTSPSAPTDVPTFTALYNAAAQQIASSGAGVAVANIPDVASAPYFTTVGPLVAKNPAIVWWQLALIGVPGVVYQKTGETIGTGVADSLSLLNGTAMITLAGGSYAGLLGQPTGKFYRDNRFPALPAGIDTTKPFGFHPQNPWPNALILDPVEVNIARTATTNFNTVIANAAATFGFALVDVNSVLTTFRAGKRVDGVFLSTTYVTGGLFSLDGVHPTNQGQAVIANEFITAINAKFNAQIPKINVASIPTSLIFSSKISSINGYPTFQTGAFDRLFF